MRGSTIVLVTVVVSTLLAVSGCSSNDSGTSTAPPVAATKGSTTGSMTAPSATGGITIDEMCAAFEATAGQNLSQVKQLCTDASATMQGDNPDSNQCVVHLQIASEKANNNKYSQQQAYDACDPNSGITLPDGSTTPLNADHKTLTP